MQRNQGVFSVLILLVVIWVILIHMGKERAPDEQLFLASVIYIVCLLPLLIYFASSEKNVPYVPLFGAVYFLYFASNIFTYYNVLHDMFRDPVQITKTLSMALCGFTSFLISFYMFPGKSIEPLFHHLNIPIDYVKTERYAIRFFIFAELLQFASFKFGFVILSAGFQDFIEYLPLLSIVMLFLLQLKGLLKFSKRLLLWFVFMPLVFLNVISGGTFASLIYATAPLFFVYFYCRQKLPVLALIIIAGPYFLIWGARDEFRVETWGNSSAGDRFQKAFLYLKLASEVPFKQKEFRSNAYDKLSNRTNHLVTFIKVVQLTPDYIPYWNGHTYTELWINIIPRFIYPDKPSKMLGQEFGHRYMFLDPSDLVTSYNLPMLVEMYINFGLWGVVGGMFVIGILLRIVYSLVNHPRCGEGGLLIGVMISANLLNIESDFSLAFGNTLQYILLFYIVLKKLKIPVSRVEITK